MSNALKCTKCGEDLGVTTVVTATPAARTKRAECPGCLSVYVIAEVLVQEVLLQGQGAHSLAKRIRDGRAEVVVLQAT